MLNLMNLSIRVAISRMYFNVNVLYHSKTYTDILLYDIPAVVVIADSSSV